MKVNLIFPRLSDSANRFFSNSFFTNTGRRLLGLGKTNLFPPLGLLMLAAVTPPDIEIQLIDERLEKIDFGEQVDLVGVSSVTRAALRAYKIADEYRKRGVAVVLGGIHPSVLPQEASLHADAVVIGEGEKVWPQVLEDCKQGCLKPIYQGGRRLDINKSPPPRRDIIRHPEDYMTIKVITATRGCENSCTFCSAGLALGKRFRMRNIQDVVDEIEATPGEVVYFADDNLGWDIDYAKELFRALIPLNIKWAGALTLSALEDMELVDLMAKSGCGSIGMGFESLSPKTVALIKKHKTNNPSRYRELIRRLHSRGIPVEASLIVGFDTDNRGIFRELVDFISETCVEMPSVNILIPYPGCAIYYQLRRENRLLSENWNYYDSAAGFVVYQPKQMSRQELVDGYLMVTEAIHSPGSVLRRLKGAGTFLSLGGLVALNWNLQKLNSVKQETPKMRKVLQELDVVNVVELEGATYDVR